MSEPLTLRWGADTLTFEPNSDTEWSGYAGDGLFTNWISLRYGNRWCATLCSGSGIDKYQYKVTSCTTAQDALDELRDELRVQLGILASVMNQGLVR